MSVAAKPEFNRFDEAILADDGDEEAIELLRCQYNKAGAAAVMFSLTIYSGADDVTFHGLEASDLKALGEHLIRLSGV